MGHKPRRRSGPGASLCPQYLQSRLDFVHRSERRQVPKGAFMLSTIFSKTGLASDTEFLITFSTSAEARCCSSASARSFRASASSPVRRSSCFFRLASDARLRATAAVLRRFKLGVLPRRALAALPPAVTRRFMPIPKAANGMVLAQTSTLVGVENGFRYCNMSCWPMSELGQNLRLPQRNIDSRLTSVSRHTRAKPYNPSWLHP